MLDGLISLADVVPRQCSDKLRLALQAHYRSICMVCTCQSRSPPWYLPVSALLGLASPLRTACLQRSGSSCMAGQLNRTPALPDTRGTGQ